MNRDSTSFKNHHPVWPPDRRSIRLKGYDYSRAGWYFITICTHKHRVLFGEVKNGEMVLNETGQFAQKCWLEIPNHFPNTILDEFVIMPNHVHGIINIDNSVGVQNVEPLRCNKYQHIIPQSIGSIVRGFKIGVTKWIRKNTNIYNVWQRNYWEHIVRNEPELNRVRKYIIENPINWENDQYYPND